MENTHTPSTQTAAKQPRKRKTKAEELEELLAKVKMMQEDIQAEANRIKFADKKKETRAKILIGAMVLAESEKTVEGKANLISRLAQYLTRDDDRAVFGLQPLP